MNVQALVKLLHALEKGPRLLRIEDVKIKQDLAKAGQMSVTMGVLAYERIGPSRGS
jgi:hypothetical protein